MIGLRSVLGAALVGWGAGIAAVTAAVPWAVPDATYRAVFKLSENPTVPEAGIALTLPEFGATMERMTDVVMTDANGNLQPLASVWRGLGQDALLLAKEMTKGQEYYVYFGGGMARQGPNWAPTVSLLMETRRLASSGSMETWPAMEEAWRKATDVDGAGWVDSISQGANLFGDSKRFITHYTGYLKTDKLTQLMLYTVSSDASFVSVNGVPEFGWPGEHSPVVSSKTPHSKVVNFAGPLTKIDYYQAKTGPGAASMALGWQSGQKMVTIPLGDWVHPGAASLERVEQVKGLPAPVPVVRLRSYMGFGGQWLYEVGVSLLGKLPEGWAVEWKFSDGTTSTQKECTHITADTSLQNVTVKLQRNGEELSGVRRVRFVEGIPASSIYISGDMQRYTDAMTRENLAELPVALLRGYVAFLDAVGERTVLPVIAEAWLKRNPDSGDTLWLPAQLSRLEALAQKDPQRALEELRAIPVAARSKYAMALDLLELDLLVFHLKDPSAVDRATQINMRDPKSELGRLALVRAGDYYRLVGRYKEAVAMYQQAQNNVVEDSSGRKLPAQDRAFSMTIRDLLERDDIDESQKKLLQWEARHPLAKLDSDFLILRGRVLMGLGRWREGLVELDSFEAMQPDSPYQIDADFYRARAMYEMGKKTDAKKIWAEIVKKYPQYERVDETREWLAKP